MSVPAARLDAADDTDHNQQSTGQCATSISKLAGKQPHVVRKWSLLRVTIGVAMASPIFVLFCFAARAGINRLNLNGLWRGSDLYC